jgi:hypothetical protein
MNVPLAQSDGGFTIIFYVVIGLAWLVSNIAQQKKAKAKAAEMKQKRLAREAEERRTGKKVETPKTGTIEQELEAFLGRLTGVPTQKTEPVQRQAAPTVQKDPPPIRRQNKPEPKITFDQEPPIQFDPQPVTPPPPPAKEPGKAIQKKSKIDELDFSASFKEIEDIKEVKDVIADLMNQEVKHEALKNVKSMMIDLSQTTMEMQTIPMPSMRPVRTKSNHPDMINKKNYRKALITSVILEPPKALQARPFEGTP